MITDKQLGIRKSGLTIMGRYGCYFLEKAIKILKTLENLKKEVEYEIIPLHETQFENKIEFLKSQLGDSSMMQHENYESPCIFKNGKYLGSLDDFTSYIISAYDIEVNHSINSAIPNAEKRREVAFNTSENDFVKIGLKLSNDQWNQVYYINVELFSKKLPKSSERFLTLCKSEVDSQQSPGYINSVCSRVQKDSFIQFGKLPASATLQPLEDEGYMVKHDAQGIIGFVGGKVPHSNISEFYITLGKLEDFDKRYVAFGRVIEGLDILKTVNQEQEFASLTPNVQVKIVSCEVWEKKPTDEYLAKIYEIENRKADCPQQIAFDGYTELSSYCQAFKPNRFNNGSEELHLVNIKAGEDLNILKKINTFNLTTLYLQDVHINPRQAINLFQSGLFFNVVNWHFENTNFDTKMLDIIFNTKHTKPAQSFAYIQEGDGNPLLAEILKNEKMQGLRSLTLNKTNLENESLEELFNSPLAQTLETLDLSHNFLIKEVVAELLTTVQIPNLTTLRLKNCYMAPESIIQISKNKTMRSVTCLDLSNNRGIDTAILEIAKSLNLKNLEELYIRNIDLTTETLFELTSSVNFSNIRKFDISFNFSLKDDLGEILLDRPFARYIEYLNLEKCDITNECVKNLSMSPYLVNLKQLDVSHNDKINLLEISEELEENKFLSNLDELYALHTAMSPDDLSKLAQDFGIQSFNDSINHQRLLDVHHFVREDIEGREPTEEPEGGEEEQGAGEA